MRSETFLFVLYIIISRDVGCLAIYLSLLNEQIFVYRIVHVESDINNWSCFHELVCFVFLINPSQSACLLVYFLLMALVCLIEKKEEIQWMQWDHHLYGRQSLLWWNKRLHRNDSGGGAPSLPKGSMCLSLGGIHWELVTSLFPYS